MRLPIAQESYQPGAEALIRAVRRSAVVLARTSAEETSLDGATLFHNAQRPLVPAVNFATDLSLLPGQNAEQLLGQVRGHFQNVGSQCFSLEPSAAQWPTALAAAAEEAGFHRTQCLVYQLARYQQPRKRNDKLQVIPARAAYRELETICRSVAVHEHAASGPALEQWQATLVDQLDEPRWEVLLARLDQKVVGMAGVVNLGQMGIVHGLFTDPSARGQGVAGTLMAHLIEHCKRALFEQVLVERVAGCYAIPLYESLGFVQVAEHARYNCTAHAPAS